MVLLVFSYANVIVIQQTQPKSGSPLWPPQLYRRSCAHTRARGAVGSNWLERLLGPFFCPRSFFALIGPKDSPTQSFFRSCISLQPYDAATILTAAAPSARCAVLPVMGPFLPRPVRQRRTALSPTFAAAAFLLLRWLRLPRCHQIGQFVAALPA